jgi:hypothetical protein
VLNMMILVKIVYWEDMNNYKGQSENLMDYVGLQGAAKKR